MINHDLCQAAVKVARRLQALPKGRIYVFMLYKDKDGSWKLALMNDGAKLEIVQA